ncbi:MAG TPA: DUF2339 domain-containing protein, partial [Actinomycetota bacterium]
MDENDESLASRVERLESDMRDLKRWARDVHVWTWGLPEELAPADQSGDAGQHGAAALAAAPAGARPMATASRAADPESEVRLVGTWFARLGALALLLGAGFAFSYAVERGLIGPAARVAIGVLAGLAMLVAGEVSRRRDWPGLAQAVSAGGLGVLTLAVWAAYSLYGLVLPVTAFASFAVITAGGVAIAIRHDSQPLAALTVIGGFLNPFLADGLEIPSGMLTYILILDAGVLVLGLRRRWRGLEWLAFTGTWLTVSTVAIDGGFEAVVGASPAPWSLRGFAMLFWALFTIHLFAAELSARRPTRGGDQVLALANGIALLAVMMELLSVSDEPWRAAFTLGMAFVHGVLGVLSTLAGRRPLAMAMYGAAVMFVTVLIPMELQGRWVAAAWAVEAVVLIVLSRGAEGARGRLVGAGLLGVSLFTSVAVHFRFGDAYRPERLIVSPESFILVIQVAALYAAAWLLLREQDGRPMAGL